MALMQRVAIGLFVLLHAAPLMGDSCSAEQADAHVRLSSCSGRVVFGPDSDTGCCPDVTLERNGDVLEVSHELRGLVDVVVGEARLSELSQLKAEIAALRAEVEELKNQSSLR